ncbi:stalk domain-containing protein [Anaerotignum sp.]
MKKNVKQILAVMMAASMATAVPVTALADEDGLQKETMETLQNEEDAADENTEEEASGESNENPASLESDAVEVTAAEDIVGAGEYIITKSFETTKSIEITENVTINLNGKTITFNGTEGGFKVTGGTLTITGSGTIEEPDTDAGLAPIVLYGVEDGKTNVTVEGDITLKGWAGIFLRQNDPADNMHVVLEDVTLEGESNGVYVNGNVDGKNNTIELNDVMIEAENGIYQAGVADTEINGGSITGTSCGIIVAAGDMEINGTDVMGGTGSGYENNGGSTGGAVEVNNTALAVIEHSTHNPASVTVIRGTFIAGAGVTAVGDVDVELNGGTFEAADEGYGIRLTDGAEVKVDGAKISVEDGFGAYVKGDGEKATTLSVKSGEISVTGDAMAIAGNAHYDNTEIIISGGEITSADGVAVYHPQEGKLEITGGSIKGTSGVYVKAGDVEISGNAEIEGTAEADFDATNNGANGTGAAVVVETNVAGGYGSAPKIEITGGTFTAAGDAVPVQNEAAADEAVVTGFISGGTFSASLLGDDVLEDGLMVELEESGDTPFSYYTDVTAAEEAITPSKGGKINQVGEGGTVETVKDVAPVTASKKKTKKYDVVIKDTENGDISVNDDYAKYGQEITVTVKPDKGYALDELIITDQNGREVDYEEGKKENTFVFDMPKSDVTMEASFEKERTTSKDDANTEENNAMKQEETTQTEPIILTIGQRIVKMNGEYIVNDVAPVLKDGRTMLPARFVLEALGADVTWDNAAKKVTVTKEETVIEIFIGQPYALVNGTPVQLDTPAFIENGRTYLPLRFMTENIGAKVEWNGDIQTVSILPATE